MLQTIYSLREDSNKIRNVQEASLSNDVRSGLKIENGLVFGSEKWFDAISNGRIKVHVIRGKISKVYMAGHNDWPEFEIENELGKTNWPQEGDSIAYKIGKVVELLYVEQKFKRPIDIFGPISKCILEIRIDTDSSSSRDL